MRIERRYQGEPQHTYALRQSSAGSQVFGKRKGANDVSSGIPPDVVTWDGEPVTWDGEFVTWPE